MQQTEMPGLGFRFRDAAPVSVFRPRLVSNTSISLHETNSPVVSGFEGHSASEAAARLGRSMQTAVPEASRRAKGTCLCQACKAWHGMSNLRLSPMHGLCQEATSSRRLAAALSASEQEH